MPKKVTFASFKNPLWNGNNSIIIQRHWAGHIKDQTIIKWALAKGCAKSVSVTRCLQDCKGLYAKQEVNIAV